jgi:asparagine synthetase B (glutamine-hydrolysing)
LRFRRLKIIDLQTSDQPLFSDDGSIILLCNGEIYHPLCTGLELGSASITTLMAFAVVVSRIFSSITNCFYRIKTMDAVWNPKRRRQYDNKLDKK